MAMVSLSDAIRHLRSELARAQKEAEPHDLRFDMREIELELQIVASEATERKADGETSGSIWSVVTAKIGASASRSNEEARTHRIKLTMSLAPKADGSPMPISAPGKALPK